MTLRTACIVETVFLKEISAAPSDGSDDGVACLWTCYKMIKMIMIITFSRTGSNASITTRR